MKCSKCPDGVAASNGGAIIILCTLKPSGNDERKVNDECDMSASERYKAKEQLKNGDLIQ